MPVHTSVKRVLRDCRNMRLHVLLTLWAWEGPPPTAIDIASEIPLDRKATGIHLNGLRRDGYVSNIGQRWFLTSLGKQIVLPGFTADKAIFTEQSEALGPTSGSSSSSSLIEEPLSLLENQLLPPLQRQSEALGPTLEPGTLSVEYQELATWLVETVTASSRLAQAAARAAQDRETWPTYTKYQALLWQAYILSGKGKAINNPGAFICRKIEREEVITEWFRNTPRERSEGEQAIWRLVDQACQAWQLQDNTYRKAKTEGKVAP